MRTAGHQGGIAKSEAEEQGGEKNKERRLEMNASLVSISPW